MAVESRQLRWLIATRLAAITSVAVLYLLYSISTQEAYSITAEETAAPYQALLYFLAGASYFLSLVYLGLLKLLRAYPGVQAGIQFLGDISLVTGLVYYFGGVTSAFSILYLIVITAAATLLSRSSALAFANIAWVAYAVLTVGLATQRIAPIDQLFVPSSLLAYRLLVHLVGFNAVAILVSFLAQQGRRTEVELERKSEDLAQLEHFHRDVTSSIGSGLITTDLAGEVITVNPAGATLLARSEDEIVGQSVEDIGLLDRDAWQRAAAADHGDHGRERSVIVRDDTEIHFGFSVSRLHYHDGSSRGFILIFQDVTGWHKLEQEVRLKDRMAAIGELSAGLAHEIGNPLAAISGSVQLLAANTPDTDSSSKLLEIILNESRRLDRTIKGFLTFAMPRKRTDSEFDIAEVLRENVELLRNSDEVTAEHHIDVVLEPETVKLVADRDQVGQIFWNLTRNALRAMPDGGRLLVSGDLTDLSYRIQFRDNGRGMSEEERRTLFQPFKTAFDQGSGLGMGIVYQIVEEHHGQLSVESAPNLGTTVTIELPLALSGVLEPMGAWT